MRRPRSDEDDALIDEAIDKLRVSYGTGFLMVLFFLVLGWLGASTLVITIVLLVLIVVLGTVVIRRRVRKE